MTKIIAPSQFYFGYHPENENMYRSCGVKYFRDQQKWYDYGPGYHEDPEIWMDEKACKYPKGEYTKSESEGKIVLTHTKHKDRVIEVLPDDFEVLVFEGYLEVQD